VPRFRGELGPHLTHVAWAEAYVHTNWHLHRISRLDATDMGQNGSCAPSFLGRGLVTSNTVWPGPMPTSVLSGILIHPAGWPQYISRKVGGAAVLLFGADGSLSRVRAVAQYAVLV